MSTNRVTITNLESGEIFPTKYKIHDDKFARRGHKLYNDGMISLIRSLTKDEMIRVIGMFNATNVDYNNLLLKPFNAVTTNMAKSARSRFKHKLLDNNIVFIHNKILMLNPFIFLPRGDKNMKNSINLAQRVWTYVTEDVDTGSTDVVDYCKHMFGDGFGKESKYLVLGKGDNIHIVPAPKEMDK